MIWTFSDLSRIAYLRLLVPQTDKSCPRFKLFQCLLKVKQADKFSTTRAAVQLKLFITTVIIFVFSRFFYNLVISQTFMVLL